MHKANRFVLWYACWHISEKRPRRGLWRELYLQRRWAPLPGALFGTGRKEEKTRLSLPPRLVGANEGGTDRPVYALPLSGSCRASTPKCTLHRSRCSAVSLSLSLSLRFPLFFLLGVTKFCRARSRHPLSAEWKKRDQVQVRNQWLPFFSFLTREIFTNVLVTVTHCKNWVSSNFYIKSISFLFTREMMNDAIFAIFLYSLFRKIYDFMS